MKVGKSKLTHRLAVTLSFVPERSSEVESCLAKGARCYKELFYDLVKSKRRHWFAVTLSFTPCDKARNSELQRLRVTETRCVIFDFLSYVCLALLPTGL